MIGLFLEATFHTTTICRCDCELYNYNSLNSMFIQLNCQLVGSPRHIVTRIKPRYGTVCMAPLPHVAHRLSPGGSVRRAFAAGWLGLGLEGRLAVPCKTLLIFVTCFFNHMRVLILHFFEVDA